MPSYLANFTSGQYSLLRQHAKETGVPISETLRQIVDRFFAQGEPCGLICSGAVVSGSIISIRVGG